MKFTVIGGGAVGLLLASYLAEQGDVTLVVRRKEQLEALQQGIRRIYNGCATIHNVHATLVIPDNAAQHIFICTKAYALTPILAQLQHVRYKTVSGCQNGLAHVEQLRPLQNSNACVVEFGALKQDDATVVHTGIGRIVIGALSGESPRVAKIDALPVVYEQHIEPIVWRKALLNCLINPLTAVMQVKNGALIQNEQLFQIVMQLHRELQQALPQHMEAVSLRDVITLCDKTAANDSSMCVDVRVGRQSEIDEIVGCILAACTRSMPTLSTLYAQVKSMYTR